MSKTYILDTNVLIDNPECIKILSDNNQNNIIIPHSVLLELDRLKTSDRLGYIVSIITNIILDAINNNTYKLKILPDLKYAPNDDSIIEEIREYSSSHNNISNVVFVTNDKIMTIRVNNLKLNIKVENFRKADPFNSLIESYSGIIKNDEELVNNCFFWENGKPFFNGVDSSPKLISYENEIWKIKPKNVYQNLALELMLNPNINITTIQAEAGMGKTYLALASAFYLVLEKKLYNKIYLTKPLIEIGEKLGYLPGDLNEKMAPYINYIDGLISKLHELRPANKIFLDNDCQTLNPKKFEILPINFIRGLNIDNALVIIDECQNLSRCEIRTLLSRMGENVKCIILGDIRQIDTPYLSEYNNGLNWIIKKFKGDPIYSHLTLKGSKSRGPICDLVLKSRI